MAIFSAVGAAIALSVFGTTSAFIGGAIAPGLDSSFADYVADDIEPKKRVALNAFLTPGRLFT